MYITSEAIKTYYTNPRETSKMLNWENRRTKVGERLLAYSLLNPDEANTEFALEVNAPGDPELTAFMRSYTATIASYLRARESITDEQIEEFKNLSYKDLNSKRSFKTLLRKAEEYSNYEAFLMKTANKSIVTKDLLGKVESIKRCVQGDMRNILLSSIRKCEKIPEDDEGFQRKTYHRHMIADAQTWIEQYQGGGIIGHLMNNLIKPHRMREGCHLVCPLDALYINQGKNKIILFNVRFIDFSLREISKFEEDYWLDLGLISHVVEALKKDYGIPPRVEFLIVDRNYYDATLTIKAETLKRCEKKLFAFENDPIHTKAFKNSGFSYYPDLSRNFEI